jgi:ribosomal protein S18 acetylase RimI-like enzyme
LKIRCATTKDIRSIYGLLGELGRPEPKSKQEKKKFEKLIQQYLSDNDKQIIIAEDNSKVVGMASIVFLTRLNQSKKEMWIPELIVSKDYQNKGIGKKLIAACISMAKKEGCFRIRLESGNKRKGTHKFYKRIGFEQYALSFRKHIK